MRTDAHRPSAIVPADYDFVSFDYVGPNMVYEQAGFILAQRTLFRQHMAETKGTYAPHENNGSCHICGACAFYLVRFYHKPSNQYISTGEDCAVKMHMSYGDMNAFRREAANAREAHAGKRKAIATLAEAGLARAWDIYDEQITHTADCKASGANRFGDDNGIENPCTCGYNARFDEAHKWEENTIRDIVSKLVKYGSISEKQTAFISRLINKIDQRPIVAAERAAEREAAAPCPTGRVRVTGIIVGRKVVEDRFDRFSGERTCIIIKANEGFKVYGSQFQRAQVGDSVDFTATITPSQNDNKFGFFKRPVPYVDRELQKLTKTIAWG